MNKGLIKKHWKLILIVCTVIFLCFWLVFGEHGLLYLKDRRGDLKEYHKKVDKLAEEKMKLEKEIGQFSDPEYIEKIIRGETGKIKKNEVIYVVKEYKEEPRNQDVSGYRHH
jgi:cell division protein FtsB